MSIWGDVMAKLLDIHNLSAGYRDAVVIDDLSFGIGQGEAVSLLGRNGVGKSTLLATMMGLTTVSKGCLEFDGKNIGHTANYQRNRMGLGYVPQEREIFASLTVEQNMRVAANGISQRHTNCSRVWKNAATITATSCQAENNRCCPWRVRWSAIQNCSCSMNRWKACRR